MCLKVCLTKQPLNLNADSISSGGFASISLGQTLGRLKAGFLQHHCVLYIVFSGVSIIWMTSTIFKKRKWGQFAFSYRAAS